MKNRTKTLIAVSVVLALALLVFIVWQIRRTNKATISQRPLITGTPILPTPEKPEEPQLESTPEPSVVTKKSSTKARAQTSSTAPAPEPTPPVITYRDVPVPLPGLRMATVRVPSNVSIRVEDYIPKYNARDDAPTCSGVLCPNCGYNIPQQAFEEVPCYMLFQTIKKRWIVERVN